MNLDKYNKIICTGIGGTGIYYIAKFFLELQKDISGSDYISSIRTQELEDLGVSIQYKNPDKPYPLDTSLVIYSQAMPREFLADLETKNPTIELREVGEFTGELIAAFRNNELSEEEKDAFIKSNISPLFTLNLSKMKYIGITGTDGKTSTSTMIYHVLKSLGHKPGLISTVSAKIGDKELDTGFHTTTPTPQELHKFLKMMEEEGCTHVILESTSHGLSMGRLEGITFDAVAYTNITSEHLDYHKTWKNYFEAKAKLITAYSSKETKIILNADDKKVFTKLSGLCKEKEFEFITYGEKEETNYRAENIVEADSLSFELDSVKITLPLLGRYNAHNALASISVVAEIENTSKEEIAKTLETFESVEGRMQILQKEPFLVVVDFAHTAFALESALKTMQTIKDEEGQVIVVFGAAGKRDDSKRIPMGRVAGKFTEITIITAEDPRSEELIAINEEIEIGWRETADNDKQTLIRFDDDTQDVKVRRDAIETAISIAQPGDIVLVAGKAHEQSLCFGSKEYAWNDIEETRKLLETAMKDDVQA